MKRNLFLFLLFLCPIGVFSQNIEVAGEIIADSINVNSGIIRNVANPILATDAATKSYVDLQILEEQLNTGIRVQDIDNNSYKTVRIGSQVWMSENLKTTRYNDGTAIPLITDDNTTWETASTNKDPAYTWYGNDASNLITYGALYNWYAIDTSSNGSRNVCPTGWHVPTDVETTTLTDYLGGEDVAGGKMKEAGEAHWTASNTVATNESGFSYLPGGNRHTNGSFDNIGNYGNWWSSTEDNTPLAWSRYLYYNNDKVYRYNYNKGFGFSVRCLRDASALTKLDSAGVADLGYVAGTKTLTEILTESADAGNKKITNLASPTDSTDAATKSYVDSLMLELETKLANKIQDVDGNVYNTTKIGGQRWMAENLRTTKYNDGTPIPLVTGNTEWDNLTTAGYCYYDNESSEYSVPYGALYNYYVVAGTNSLNVCPEGWHVPSDTEWTTLTTYLGGIGVAGGKMKETGTFYWNSPNTGATNESGFAGLPGGYRFTNGAFVSIGNFGYWWSSTEVNASDAWSRYLDYVDVTVFRSNYNKGFGFSVRCLRD